MKTKRRSISSKLRLKVYQRDCYTCQYCGCKPSSVKVFGVKFNPPELDHKIPLFKGGSDDFENLILSCRSCNRRKKDKLINNGKNKNYKT